MLERQRVILKDGDINARFRKEGEREFDVALEDEETVRVAVVI